MDRKVLIFDENVRRPVKYVDDGHGGKKLIELGPPPYGSKEYYEKKETQKNRIRNLCKTSFT